MLPIRNRDLPADAENTLASMQRTVNREITYAARVVTAKRLWDAKLSTRRRADAFRAIRATLSQMCVGPIRCAYCEDSLADEVEHIYPKNLFPELAFRWLNYAYACGPCNGPKSNRYGVVVNDRIEEFVRQPRDPVEPPPRGQAALLDPRSEDPTAFLELDLGGETPDGLVLEATFEFLPLDGISQMSRVRAEFTIEVLGLNREVLRVARSNAFGGFRARLREYAERRLGGAGPVILNSLRDDLLRTPHLSVFSEMRRQRQSLPEINELFTRAPEAAQWPLILPE